MENPINAVTTKFVRTSTNKLRCPIFCVAVCSTLFKYLLLAKCSYRRVYTCKRSSFAVLLMILNMNYNVKWQIKFWFAETYISVLVKLRMVAFYLIYFLNIIWTEWNALMKGMSKNLLIQALSLSPSLFQRVMNFVCWSQICLSKVGIFPVFKQNPLFSLAFCPFFCFLTYVINSKQDF